jgi:membrane protease YdiL (CAAX protease family)
MALFWRRVAALVEVVAMLALVHIAYRSFKHFTPLGQVEASAADGHHGGLNFSSGTAMILFTVAFVALGRRSFAEYGLTIKGWRRSLNIGLMWGLLVVIVAGLVIKLAHVHFDPLHPPDLQRAILFTICELVSTVLLLLFLRRDRAVAERLPAAASLLILLAVLSAPCVIALWFDRPILDTMLSTLWLFFCAGFGEEFFFRGYIQSRVDEAFGRPYRFLGVDFGVGLFVSAALFGLIHVFNTVDYFHDQWNFAWLWWWPSFGAGLFFGILRAKTGSIVAGGVIHGVTDVLARVPALLP